MRHQDLVILTSIHGISFERIDKNHEKYQNFFILKEENHQSIMISLMELRMTVMEDENASSLTSASINPSRSHRWS